MKKSFQKIKSKKGFTLVEILVIVLIIGILAAVALPQYKMAVYRTRYASLMLLADAIYQAEERFYLVHGDYTDDMTNLDMDLSDCTLSNNNKTCTFDSGYCSLSVVDPNSGAYLGSSVSCSSNGFSNKYAYFFRMNQTKKKKMRACFAKGTDKTNTWNQFCKNIGAMEYIIGIGCPDMGGNCNAYAFSKS